MADLWVLVPSRGRPKSVDRLVRACALTCRADTRLHFGFDLDDDTVDDAKAAAGGHKYMARPRMGLAAWTNYLADWHVKAGDAAALASFGDDHVPITDGWDERLLAAIAKDHGGLGFAYPNDRQRADVPEAVVISAPIVKALGWMALPACDHWWIDNVWRDLGSGAGCLTYCEDVIVEHRTWIVKGRRTSIPRDATYIEAAPSLERDGAAYRAWRLRRMRHDIAVIKTLRAEAGL